MTAKFSFGDLVVVKGGPGTAPPAPPAPPSTMVAVVAELRRDDCRAQYLREQRSVWTALGELRHARETEIEGSLEKTVHDLLAMLRAVELEFTLLDPGRCRLVASHGAFTPDTLDSVRTMLGDRMIRCLVRPQGMHRLQTILEFTL